MVVSDNNQLQKFENDDVAQYYFEILRQLIAKKSIFAQQIGLAEVANYLGDIFTEAGAEVTIDDTCTAPFVLARFKSNRPDAQTIIFYNHYDTVPADDDQPWSSNPFELTVRDGYMYGRGVDDDKGHITARLTAVQKYRREFGDFPVNIIFIMEGSEESASVGLETYLEKYADELRGADLLVWEQGISNAKGQIEISGGTKGIVTFDMIVDSAKVDIHSKFGAVIESASWYLLNAIASLRDETGRILVDGIYDQVIEPSERELSLILEHANLDADNLKTLYGLNLPMLTRDKEKLVRTLFFEPAITIEGISTGYQGQGVKTILPAKAQTKMEVRLVPGLEPKDVLQKIEQHLQQHGFEQVELVYTLGEKAYRSDMSAPTILNVIEIAKTFSPNGVSVLPTTAGTGPMHQFFEVLEVPIASFGIGNPDSRDHAGDENVNLADYYTHIEMIEELIKSYEKTDY
ncbi:M20/M25/M40 family metallo-hydrolase [Streptococcus macedonicus]|uniref:M20/M25/M40 family metallo-hydrolase n=2 Tax=Lactobacillales TaxID=186826 RepID=A0A081JFM4_STRMC|nr:M20/M25/M40 family metallo-hydrolase [Streptococcus macedonicus]CCF03050.1 Acetylornithine deacetylase/Succinyl-diaminopimelate desuccinylase and related deacylases [Streptococcus macedonicus ACA-DC 198]KEH51637.1 peptidase M20 [Streptococcus macedonicus]MBF6977050.1 M20/M25/M40 family metallo-hydrolase [Streptococcus macedonicus]MBT1047464.1 M20/M25/M40 family metallo-hydrolase [Streptococcus macedonicus]MCW8485868.1 M20/M25/M40 family metallo-hydrolase [Streptococcus macedonicus]